jgi:autotransporter passenger strand-loop-strand repeat protein
MLAGAQVIESGGTASGSILSGGTEYVYGTDKGATVFAGSQVVEAGGTASGTTVSSGGTLVVLTGGSALAPAQRW